MRYGKHGAAMTANVITYRGRSAAREVGKVLGFESSTLDSLSTLANIGEWKDPNNTTHRKFSEAGLRPIIRVCANLQSGAGPMGFRTCPGIWASIRAA